MAKSQNPAPSPKPVDVAAAKVAEEQQADVYLYAGGIDFPSDRVLSACVQENRSRPNAVVYLATFGGSADSAYRMARCLQSSYRGGAVRLCVVEFCKSAGTLLAIGATEIVMSDDAELGPLDVQIATHDSLAGRTSGLTPIQALATLREEAFKCFETCFLDVIRRSGGRLSTRTASSIAVRMATGLFRPVFAQIEPMRLGEYGRSLLVAADYGQRLNKWSKNLRAGGLDQLVAGYPSHEFVIDRAEAATLFTRVRPPTDSEDKLTGLVAQEAMAAIDAEQALVKCLTKPAPPPVDAENDHDTPEVADRAAPSPAGGTHGGPAAAGRPNRKSSPDRGGGHGRTTHDAGADGLPSLAAPE